MSPEFEQHLREKYPKLFSGRCDLSIEDGWFDLVNQLCDGIQSHIDVVEKNRQWNIGRNKRVNDPEYDWKENQFIDREERKVDDPVEQVIITQIKEKFGTLRFYYGGGDLYISGLVAMAESMSSVLCEKCGNPGHRYDNKKWVRILCDFHAEKMGYVDDEFTSIN